MASKDIFILKDASVLKCMRYLWYLNSYVNSYVNGHSSCNGSFTPNNLLPTVRSDCPIGQSEANGFNGTVRIHSHLADALPTRSRLASDCRKQWVPHPNFASNSLPTGDEKKSRSRSRINMCSCFDANNKYS